MINKTQCPFENAVTLRFLFNPTKFRPIFGEKTQATAVVRQPQHVTGSTAHINMAADNHHRWGLIPLTLPSNKKESRYALNILVGTSKKFSKILFIMGKMFTLYIVKFHFIEYKRYFIKPLTQVWWFCGIIVLRMLLHLQACTSQ